MDVRDDSFHEEAAVSTPLGAPEGLGGGVGYDPRNKHPDYTRSAEAWKTTRDVYLGAEAMVPKAEDYVPQRKRGEHEDNYDERKSLLHFDGLLGVLIDAVIGLWARKSPEEDTWGTLGERGEDDELSPDSLAAKIVKDADRAGTNWDNHRRARATWMLVFRRCYTYIDTNKKPSKREGEGPMTSQQARQLGVRPFAKIVSPVDVTDWIEKDGRKIDVTIQESVDIRDSLDAGRGKLVKRYLRLRPEGWSRYEVRKGGESEKAQVVESATYHYVDEEGRPRIPLVECELPMPRYSAYNLALMVRALVNHDSHLDALLRAAALAQKLTVQGDEEEVRKCIKDGDAVLSYPPNTNKPEFIAFLMNAAAPIESRIEKLTERFWQSAMYEFSDRAAQKTATEVEQEWASGVGAFLALIAGASEEAENEEKFLLAQAAKPVVGPRPNMKEAGKTKFSRDYRVEDVIAELQRVKDLVFGMGEGLPVGSRIEAAIALHLLNRLHEHSGLLSEVPDDVDVEAEVTDKAMQKELDAARMRTLGQEIDQIPGFEEEEEEEAKAA